MESAPLPARPTETSDQAATSIGMRVVADADALPEDIVLCRALDAAHDDSSTAVTNNARNTARSRLAALEFRYAIARAERKNCQDKDWLVTGTAASI